MRVASLLLASTLLLTGCWSRVEINDRLFVTGIFVDKGNGDNIELTLAFPLPSRLTSPNVGGTVSSGKPYSAVTKSGRNFSDAFRKIQADLPRKISWGQAKIIVFGEELARKGILPVLEFTARDPTFNLGTAILVSPGKASEIAGLVPAVEKFPSEVARELTQKNNTLNTTVKDFLETERGNMVVGMLTKGKKKMISENGKKALWVGTGGMALFKDFKLVAKVNQGEGRGALWLQNRMENAGVTLKSPTDQKTISLMVLDSKTKIRPSKSDPYTFNIFVNAEDDLLESNSNIPLTDPKSIRILEKKAANKVKDRIEAIFHVSKENGADVFNLADYLSWYRPKIWNSIKHDWDAIYKEKVKLNIYVTLHIRRPGSEKNPFWLKEKQT
jgi:spore germination protein KC